MSRVHLLNAPRYIINGLRFRQYREAYPYRFRRKAREERIFLAGGVTSSISLSLFPCCGTSGRKREVPELVSLNGGVVESRTSQSTSSGSSLQPDPDLAEFRKSRRFLHPSISRQHPKPAGQSGPTAAAWFAICFLRCVVFIILFLFIGWLFGRERNSLLLCYFGST